MQRVTGGPQMTMFGTDYHTSDGTCERDYIHVTDFADAHVKALKALEGGHRFDVHHLGNGRGFAVLQLVGAVEQTAGLRVPIQHGSRRADNPVAIINVAAKARLGLNWQASLAGFDEIVRTAWGRHQKTLCESCAAETSVV